MELLLDLMHNGGPRAARAANAAMVSLATNADNHLGLVSLGLAPALVATLQAGKALHTARGVGSMLHKHFGLLLLILAAVLGVKLQHVPGELAGCMQLWTTSNATTTDWDCGCRVPHGAGDGLQHGADAVCGGAAQCSHAAAGSGGAVTGGICKG